MSARAAILILSVSLLSLAWQAADEPLRVSENLRHEQVLLPPSAPDRDRLLLVRRSILTDETGFGVAAVYDDPKTSRNVDYVEVYGAAGDLLMIFWIDEFGICQVAVDQGLLDEEEPHIDGVLVIVTEGTSV
ncbi:MAG TPA: hypothetical protein VNL14_12170 [Candidatus Acidoferrales bacterium]|nr:hypothetical protein [Candidatus Acidoferrales bacterium]